MRRVIDSVDRATILNGNTSRNGLDLYRSKTPIANLYSTQTKEILPIWSKTPLVGIRRRAKTSLNELNGENGGIDGAVGGRNEEIDVKQNSIQKFVGAKN